MRFIQKGYLYQLTFLPRMFPVNCYLVEEEKELTLIDCALPYSHKAILQTAHNIGKPITRIVLTHAHEDHVGSLDRLKEALPDTQVIISKRDSRLLKNDIRLDADEPNTPIRGGIPKNIKTQPDQLVHEGEQIGSLRVIATPGHTPGSISLFDERSRAMIVGDALQTRGGVAVSGDLRWQFPFPAWATWSPELALQSAKKILALTPSLIAVGHGRMIENLSAMLEEAIARAERKWGEKEGEFLAKRAR